MPGNTAIKLTTARYFTPSGRSIQATGIVPDIVVEESANGGSSQQFLREADLQNHLENANKPKDTKTPAQPQAKPQSAPKNEEEPAEPPSRELASKSDYQLSQALNLLKGLQIMQNKPQIDQSASHETPDRDAP